MATPIYFESSWAELSTIGLISACVGIMIAGITSFSPIVLVPIIVSAAAAIADGLCFYAFYEVRPTLNTALASAVADIAWLVQEAGLSFYSFVILRRVLQGRSRAIFQGLFWTLIACICAIRMVILVTRIRYIMGGNSSASLQSLVDDLHVAYFSTIAIVECVSAFFLLRRFSDARRVNANASTMAGAGKFSYLMRSTEVRLALLAVIGITRAITYSFQRAAQAATSTASQLDRFAYSLECLFPVIMYIDILASRLVFTGGSGATTSSGMQRNRRQFTHTGAQPTERAIEIELEGGLAHGVARAGGYGANGKTDSDPEFDEPMNAVSITKTVEFRVDRM